MKNIICIVLIAAIFLCPSIYALDNALFDTRSDILKNAKDIKNSLDKTKDLILMNSLWDSCIMSISQLDAYFYMIRIFNTIEKEDLKEEAVDSIIYWLNNIKKTNELDVKNLVALKAISSDTLEAETKLYMEKVKANFGDLNKLIDIDLKKILVLKATFEKNRIGMEQDNEVTR